MLIDEYVYVCIAQNLICLAMKTRYNARPEVQQTS